MAWTLASMTASVVAFTVYLHTRIGGDWTPDLVLFTAIVPAPVAIGLVIARRRPGNVIGLLLLCHALLVALVGLAGPYAQYGLIDHPGSLPGAAWGALDAYWPLLYAGLVAIALVFPDGRLPSRRWRSIAIGAGVAFAGLVITTAIGSPELPEPFENFEKPLPTLPEGSPPVFAPFWLATLAALVAGAVAVRVRLRRAEGVERQQLLWLACGTLFIPGALLVVAVNEAATGGVPMVTVAAMVVMELAIPVAVGVAILRYRLFDIELVLSRTLLYGALTLCVIATYVVIVGGLSSVVGSRGVLGLAATGVVAVAVQPLRVRLQARVNRAIYGDRDDPYAALSRLGGRLQATLAPDAVTGSIVETVAEALRVPFVAIEFVRDGDFETVASTGERRTERLERTPLTYQGEPIGRLVVDSGPGRELAAADRRLLADLARHAGVALHGVRLTVDLQRSRERLVAAREEERRRLRRDLHDSLGPALAGMAFRLDAAGNLLGSDPATAADLLRDLRAETDAAIGDIRRVVHELRPPALDELGLIPALRANAERLAGRGTGLRVQVDAPQPFPELPAAVEVAGYRIALESLTNVSRHAGARVCVLSLQVDGELAVEVSDDGAGMDPERPPGVGLASMRERATELGGRLEVRPRAGGGTVVRATLPVGGRA